MGLSTDPVDWTTLIIIIVGAVALVVGVVAWVLYFVFVALKFSQNQIKR